MRRARACLASPRLKGPLTVYGTSGLRRPAPAEQPGRPELTQGTGCPDIFEEDLLKSQASHAQIYGNCNLSNGFEDGTERAA